MEPQTAPRELSRRRCLRLLGTANRGRLVVVHQVLPVVQPVAYRIDGGDVLAEVEDRFVPPRAVTDTIVAFQADDLESDPLDGWTVTVVGHAHPAGDTAEHTPSGPDDDHPARGGRTDRWSALRARRRCWAGSCWTGTCGESRSWTARAPTRSSGTWPPWSSARSPVSSASRSRPGPPDGRRRHRGGRHPAVLERPRP